MPLSLDDVLNAPTDPTLLNRHLQTLGLVPAPMSPTAAAPAAPTTVAPMAPRTMTPMTPPVKTHETVHVTDSDPGPEMASHAEIGSLAPPAPRVPLQPLNVAGLDARQSETATPDAVPGGIQPMVPPTPSAGSSLLNAPRKTLESFKSREQDAPDIDRIAPVGQGPQLVEPGTAAYDRNKIDRMEDEKHNHYGTPENHPGVIGKILHGLAKAGNIAGNIVAPGTMALIPGTDLNKRVEEGRTSARMEREQAGEVNKQRADTEKANVESEGKLRTAQTAGIEQTTARTAQPTLTQDAAGDVNGWKDEKGAQHSLNDENTPYELKEVARVSKGKKPEEVKNILADRVQKVLNDGGDIATDPQVQALSGLMKNAKPETQEENKLGFQKIVGKVAGAGLPTDVKMIDKSIAAAAKRGLITPQEYAEARAYQAANPTPGTSVAVTIAGAQGKEDIKNANNYYRWTGADGQMHAGKGNEVPPGVEPIPIGTSKEMATYTNEGHASNIVQQSLNTIAKDVHEHPELFDNATARNIMATTLEQVDREAAGMLIAGTGGHVPLPSGLGDMINTALQNNALDDKTSRALKNYIADYKAMKDKVIVQQMEMQGGKIGRSSVEAFKAIANQIPNGSTPDSLTAKRQMENLQRTQDELSSKYAEYGDFKKEKPYQAKESAGGEAGEPKKGDIREGRGGVKYEFQGGDKHDKNNWKKQ